MNIKSIVAALSAIVGAAIVSYVPELQTAENELITLISAVVLVLIGSSEAKSLLVVFQEGRGTIADIVALVLDLIEEYGDIEIPDHVEGKTHEVLAGKE
jgi:hypothetical protein